MAKIFISYRREDSKHAVGRLHAALKSHVKDPKRDIFIDIDNIPRGVDFVDYLDGQVAKCDIMLAVIGPTWLNAADSNGKRRLDDPQDFVRIEIASALKRGIPVVPVMLDQTSIPRTGDLPADLEALARRNGERLAHESFDADVSRLIRNLPESEGDATITTADAATPATTPFDLNRFTFISYPKDVDPALMRSIVRTLVTSHIPVWLYDPASFGFHKSELASMRWQRAGSAWEAQTLDAIGQARCVLALIGRSTIGSKFQERELEAATNGGRIVTVVVDDLPFERLPQSVQGLHAPRISPEVVNERMLAMLASDVAEQMSRPAKSRQRPRAAANEKAPKSAAKPATLRSSSGAGWIALVVVLALAGGGAWAWFVNPGDWRGVESADKISAKPSNSSPSE